MYRRTFVILAAAGAVLAAAAYPRGGAGARGTAGGRGASAAACAGHVTSQAAAVGQASAYSSVVSAATTAQAVQAPAEMKAPGRPNITVAPGEDKPLPRREEVPQRKSRQETPRGDGQDDQELSRGGLPLAGAAAAATASPVSTRQASVFSSRCH